MSKIEYETEGIAHIAPRYRGIVFKDLAPGADQGMLLLLKVFHEKLKHRTKGRAGFQEKPKRAGFETGHSRGIHKQMKAQFRTVKFNGGFERLYLQEDVGGALGV